MSDVSETAERSPETVGAPPGAPERRPRALLSRAATMFLKQREASVLAIAVVLFIYFAVRPPAFVSHGNFVNIAQYMAPYVIIGIGLVLLMVCGEIDLSVGFVWTLSPYVMHFFIDSGIPTFLAIVITSALGGRHRGDQRRRHHRLRRPVADHHARHRLTSSSATR